MPTDELESQLRSTLARAAADFENPGQARRRLLQRDYHPRGGHRRLAVGVTAGAALVVGLAAVIAVAGHGPATKATPSAAPALRTRLLAAIDTASGDILYTHAPGRPLSGGQYPAYPRPGQEVHVRVGPAVGSDGKVYKDGEFSFTMTSANPAQNYTAHLDQGGLHLSGTALAVDHFNHTWRECHSKFILGFTLDAAGIRAELANGQFTVIGRTELNGQQAIGLKFNVPPNNEAPPHVTAERMWVNATTYLPMRDDTRWSDGQQSVADYAFLPPPAGRLAKLHPVIPAGYTRADCSQGTGSAPQTRGFPPPR